MSAVPASPTTAIDELRVLLGERLSTSTGVRDHHSKDESWHHPHRPDAVAFPNTTEEVAGIVRICASHRTPVIAYGNIYLTARDGVITVVKAGPKFEQVSVNTLPDQFAASPAISDGHIYLHGFAALYSIGPKGH